MNSNRAILDVLFPLVRSKLMRLLFAEPVRQFYGRELAVRSGLALHTVQDELRKLTAVGLLTSSSNGYQRFFCADQDHPVYPHLLRIVQLSQKLPRTKKSALRRPTTGRVPRVKTKTKLRRLRPERPLSWHLFQGRKT